MCLVLIAWDSHPRYRVILAANRDEFHDRPTAPMHWWDEAPGLLAGRDLQSGGTWMAIGANGRFGALANYYLADAAPPEGLRSRGDLIPGWITGDATLDSHARGVVADGQRYGKFNCLLGDLDGLYLVSNCDATPLRKLSPGVHGLSNDLFERPWPKVTASCQRLETILSDERDIGPDALVAMLDASQSCAGHAEADAHDPVDWRRATPMVIDEVHGTRATTVILVGRDGQVTVAERRFDRDGAASGQDAFRFSVGADPRVR